MKRVNLLFALFLPLSIFFIGSCTKTGPVGPEGAQGEQGPPGPKGDPGVKGDDGATGSAEIILSDWISIKFRNQDNEWLGYIEDPAITQKYVDSADINIFIKTDGNIYALNYFKVDEFYVTQEVKVGQIIIHSSFDASLDSFRYVLIPAGAPAIARKMKSVIYEKLIKIDDL